MAVISGIVTDAESAAILYGEYLIQDYAAFIYKSLAPQMTQQTVGIRYIVTVDIGDVLYVLGPYHSAYTGIFVRFYHHIRTGYPQEHAGCRRAVSNPVKSCFSVRAGSIIEIFPDLHPAVRVRSVAPCSA